jgi:hypothetical protein
MENKKIVEVAAAKFKWEADRERILRCGRDDRMD